MYPFSSVKADVVFGVFPNLYFRRDVIAAWGLVDCNIYSANLS